MKKPMLKRLICWLKGHKREDWKVVGGWPIFELGKVVRMAQCEARSSRCLRCGVFVNEP